MTQYNTGEKGYQPWPADISVPKEGTLSDQKEMGEIGNQSSILGETSRDIDLLSYKFDHDGHASCVLLLNPNKITYTSACGWLYYTGSHWEADGADAWVSRAIVATLRARGNAARSSYDNDNWKLCKASKGNVEGIKNLLRDKSEVYRDIREFDADPNLLNVQNGVIDLRNGTLRAHDPDQKFTYCNLVPFAPDARSDEWGKFVLEAVGNNQDIADYLQMAIGYSITGHTREEVLFYVYGPPRSGKGVFTETVLAVLDKPLSVEADFTTFSSLRNGDTQSFDLAPLRPCRLVAASESNKQHPLNPAKIKQLTGGNHVRCAYKYRNHFEYRPTFKIWLSSNHLVDIDIDDSAAWARVRVINFPNSHLGNEDKLLKSRLLELENLKAVLAWMVEGARRWYQSPTGLVAPEAVIQATAHHREEQDFVAQLLMELVVDDEYGWTSTEILYKACKDRCAELGITPKSEREFSQAVARKGYRPAKKDIVTKSGEKKQRRGFMGLRLR